MMSHQIKKINKEVEIMKNEPNRNSGVDKYNWNENFTRRAQYQIWTNGRKNSVTLRINQLRLSSLKK